VINPRLWNTLRCTLKCLGEHEFSHYSSIHSAVCHTTGPLPLPNCVLHRVWSSVSPFNLFYPLFPCIPYWAWFKKMDSISYFYISWTIYDMWMIYIKFERGDPKVWNIIARVLERSPSAQPCSSVSWEQNGYYAAQEFCVREFIKTESATAVQRAFRLRFNIQPPTRKNICHWNHQFEQIGCLCKGKSSGQPRVSEENVRRIQKSFERSPRNSTRRASRELGIPQQTVRRVLGRRLLFNWVHLFESPFLIYRLKNLLVCGLRELDGLHDSSSLFQSVRYCNMFRPRMWQFRGVRKSMSQ